jgi:DNA polymerase-3 subunit delta'
MAAMTDLLAAVPADPAALAALRAAAVHPVHAYLLVGAPGTGTMEAALAFAATVLSGTGTGPGDSGTGDDDVARRVSAGLHPDVVVIEREGASITIDAAREVARLAARSPLEGARKVLVLNDFHLVRDAGPALLKTIEEPPPSTIFVILAEYLPPELVTIASRCVRIDFAPLARDRVVATLVAEGVEPGRAAELAEAAGGRLDRARLLAADPDVAARRHAWSSVPGRLDGSGAVAAAVVDELINLLDASVAPLRARQEAEMAALEARNARSAEINGKVGRGARAAPRTGVKDLEERHKREVRRQRTDELRAGLAVLAGAYRDRLAVAGTRDAAVAAVGLIDRLGADLVYNPGEVLALQALFAQLGRPELAATSG